MQLDERVVPETRPDDVPRTSARRRAGRRGRLGVAVVVVLAIVLGLIGTIRYADDISRSVDAVTADEARTPADRTVLADLWRAYTDAHLEPGTNRTVDPQSGGITTSEGQSYTMLRSVWMDDLPTFTASWQWTKDNLQRDDSLMAWRFGPRADGSYGIQDELGGGNSATDADVDIAFALLMAYSRWKEDDFFYDALPIIGRVWEKEVVTVGGEPVLVANDVERTDKGRQVLVNPSYFAPYAYRVFAKVDPQHDWPGVVDSSYAVLQQLDAQPLDAGGSAGLPPDWVLVDRRTGEFSAAGTVDEAFTSNFGYDALRSPWRLALDERWYGEQRARDLLDRQAVLADQWTADRRLAGVYGHDGTPVVDYDTKAMYGGAMGYFVIARPDLADEIYADELLPVHDADTGELAEPLGYYDSNWVWFGMALYLDQLPNLTVTDG